MYLSIVHTHQMNLRVPEADGVSDTQADMKEGIQKGTYKGM